MATFDLDETTPDLTQFDAEETESNIRMPVGEPERQAGAVSYLKKDEPPEAVYPRNVEEISQFGTSQDIEDLKMSSMEKQVQNNTDLLQSISFVNDPVVAENIILNQGRLLEQGGLSLSQMVTAEAASRPVFDDEDFNVQFTLAQQLDLNAGKSDSIQQIVDEYLAGGNVDDLENLADLIGTFAPDFAADGIDIINRVLPPELLEDTFSLDFGGQLAVYKEHLRSLDTESAKALALSTVQAIEEELDFLGVNDENDLKRFFATMTFLGNANPTDSEIEFDANLERVFQVLEWIPALGMLARGAQRMNSGVRSGSVLGAITKGNKAEGQKTVDNALAANSDEELKPLGVTKDEVVTEHVLPKADTATSKKPNGPDATITTNGRVDSILAADRSRYTDADLARSTSYVDKAIERLQKARPNVMVSASTIRQGVGDSLNWTKGLVLSKNSRYGFGNIREAQDVVTLLGESLEGARVSFFRGDPNRGQLIKLVRGAEDVEEVVIQKAKTQVPSAMSTKIDALRVLKNKAPESAQFKKAFNTIVDEMKAKAPNYSKDTIAESLEQVLESAKAGVPKGLQDWVSATFKGTKFPDDIDKADEIFVKVEVDGILSPRDVGEFAPSTRALAGGFGDIPLIGNVAKYLDAAANFSKDLLDLANNADFIDAAVRREFREVLKPYARLSRRDRNKVNSLLEKAEKMTEQGTLDRAFTVQELGMEFNGNKKLVEAYLAVRSVFDMTYQVMNTKAYREAKQEGFLHFVDGEYQGLAKSVDNIDNLPPQKEFNVFKSDSETIETYTKEKLQKELDGGATLFESKFTERAGDNGTTLFLSTTARLEPMPLRVLKYRPNYIPRVHLAGAIIREKKMATLTTSKGITESVVGQAVKTARTPKEAEAWIRTNGKSGEYEASLDRTNDTKEYLEGVSLDAHNSSGNLFFSKRGSGITSISGQYNMAAIEDAITIAAQRASHTLSLGQLVETQKSAWMKTYNKILFTNGNKPFMHFPSPEELKGMRKEVDIRKEKGSTDPVDYTRLFDEAVAHAERIHAWEGLQQPEFMKAWNKLMNKIALNVVEPAVSKVSVEKARDWTEFLLRMKTNPISDAKAFNFATMISANPARQLLIQMQQATVYFGVEGGLGYFGTGRYFRDFYSIGLITMAHAKGEGAAFKAINSVSKKLGYADGELEKIRKAWVESGFIERVGTNQLISRLSSTARKADDGESSLIMNEVKNAGESVYRGAASILELSEKFGFRTGELVNLQAAWLMALRRYQIRNPGLDAFGEEAQRIIKNDANQLSLNMGRTGRLAYQDGALSLAFQFMSIQQKTAQLFARAFDDIPKIGEFSSYVSNKQFTTSEARRIAVIQTGLYGTAGLGANKVWENLRDESGIVLDQTTNEIIEGGFVEIALNKMFDTDLAISSSLAPMQGVGGLAAFLPALKESIFDIGPEPLSHLFLGATFSSYEKLSNALSMIKDISFGSNLSTGKALAADISEFATILSGYNNFVKARAAMAAGYTVSSNGNKMVQASGKELVAKALLGIGTKNEEDAFRIFEALEGKKAGLGSSGSHKADLDSAAADYHTNMLKIAQRYGNGEDSFNESRRLMNLNSKLYRFLYDENELLYMSQKVREKEENLPFQDRISTILINNIDTFTSGEQLRAFVMNSPDLFKINTPSEKEEINRIIGRLAEDIDSVKYEDIQL